MKELSIEEKANRYDEVLKQIKECTPDENGFVTIYPNEIFPELKESEDEKIRCTLINHFKTQVDLTRTWNGLKNTDILAWLEKQGKQMSDKIEPKFKVGDTIQTKQGQLKFVIGRIDNEYYRRKGNNAPMLRISDQDDWELVERNSAWSEEDITHYNRIIEELSIQKEKPINASYVELINSDIDWLKSLKDRVGCEMNCTTTKEWSEEDENRFNNLCWLIDKSDENEPTKNGFKNWLKERVLPQQPKQEWSEEGKQNLKIEGYENLSDYEKIFDDIADKYVRNKNQKGYNQSWYVKERATEMLYQANKELKKKANWSEEDGDIRDNIIRDLKRLSGDMVSPNQTYQKEIQWLKSLKNRYTWKPSDEQMNALHDAAVYVDKSMFPYPKGILMKLYKQLKN